MIKDGIGIYGCILHYSMLIAIVGSSFLIFIYLWRKGRLDMDEEPKWEMMKLDDEEDSHE
ncbi:MAG: hypothetical protein K940chlam7_00272 [Chlamydiae bacterium]|nr:hypothetical protein [Chlamydiota bacterium]